MAEELHKEALEGSNANDILESLTKDISPEMAQHTKKLVMAMKNASAEDYNALLELLSKSNVAIADEKPSAESEDNVALATDVQVDGCDGNLVQSESTPMVSDSEVKVEDHQGPEADLNGEENSKNGYDSEAEKLTDQFKVTNDNSFGVSDGSKLPGMSDEDEKPADELPATGESSAGDVHVHGDVSSSDDEKLPELLSNKAEDTCSEIEDGEVKEFLEVLPAGIDTSVGEKLTDQFKVTNDNSSGVSDGSKWPGLSDEDEKPADELPAMAESSAGDVHVHGDVSSSDDEKLPELLSNKAEDTCSEIEDGEVKEFSEVLPAGIDTSGENKSTDNLAPSLQGDSHLNLLSESTETEKRYSKAADYDSSSDDDHMALSSSHSEVTSTESDLSDVVAPGDAVATQSQELNNDSTSIDNNVSSLSITRTKEDDIAICNDDALYEEAGRELADKSVQALERMSSVQSTGTQTSSEPDENLQPDQLANDQISNTSGGLDHKGLDSILCLKETESSKLPFYYQPQIVMHGEQPVLVLQPVASSLPSDNGDIPAVENGAVKATVPIILPLTSPDIDKATKDAILKQINGESHVTSSTSYQGDSTGSLMHAYSSAAPPSLNTASGLSSDKDGDASSARPDTLIINSEPMAETNSEIKNEGLFEWVPSSELDIVFSAAAEEVTVSTTEETSATLTFPKVSLPSTNPFAKDLAAQQSGQSEVRAEDLSSFGLDETLQQSLFGPPSSSSVPLGARPKQVKSYQEPGQASNATNPFAPDLMPKKRGRRQEEDATEHSTEVVVRAEVHPSVSQSAADIHTSPRSRLSSESMVTLIETTYADTPASSAELHVAPAAIDNTSKIHVIQAQEDPKPQLESKEMPSNTVKPKLRVPGKVAPFWIPDIVCSNCNNCKIKFTVFLRKHHCRGCGKIFCNNCCSQLARFPYMDYKIGRVCSSCTKAIKEVHRAKRLEQLSKQSSSQQTTPGTPQTTSVPQTRNAPQGLVISNAHAQSTSTMVPIAQTQQLGTAVSTAEPLNQGIQRSLSSQPAQYQPLSVPSVQGQQLGMPVTARVQPHGSQGVMMPAQPANQYQPLSVPSVQGQQSGMPVTARVQPQGSQGVMMPAQPANQYQPLSVPSVQGQQSGMPVTARVQPQESQGVMMPAQPANQYMWVPASVVQPHMPVVYVNPIAPSLQGGPVFVPFNPQQTPVVLMAGQPSSSAHLPQATTQASNTMASGGWKGAAPVANNTSSGTVSTFTVLPQQVGQAAVQEAQRRRVQSAKQPATAVNQASNSVSSVLPAAPSLSQSHGQGVLVPGQPLSTASYPSHTMALPSMSSLQQSSPTSVTPVAPSQTHPVGLTPATLSQYSLASVTSMAPPQTHPTVQPSMSSLQQSSPTSLTPVAPSQTHPVGLTPATLSQSSLLSVTSMAPPQTHPIVQSSTSSLQQSSPLTITTAAPTQKPPNAVVNSPQKGTETQGIQRSREADGSFLIGDETDPSLKDLIPPLRRAGRTITWRYRTQGKSRLQEQKKSLAKDLRDLPSGVTIQAAPGLLIHVKKMKVKEKHRELHVWCYQSEGLNDFSHLEVVVMLEVRKKEEIFPEEVLRVYRGILHLASKLGNSFQHGNYLSSNDQFLDSSNDAGFIFVASEVKPKPPGLEEIQTPFLYAILVKRPELSAAMFTPSRLLLRLGYDMKSFPFPLWNCRDRKPINLGNLQEDRFFHTVFAMNKYLKNSVPEAMVPGLYVVKEGNKVILQIPYSGQTAVVNLLDRLIKKENQTATVPLVSDIPPYVDNCKVVISDERGGKYVQCFGNPNSTTGLGFLMLHLGVEASSPLNFGGELLDDGVLVFFSKTHAQKLRQSLEGKTNCYFYLGDKFDIAHFELRWMQDANYHDIRQQKQTFINPYPALTTAADTPAKESGADCYPGLTTIDIRYSSYGSEVELLKKVFDDHTKILHILEGNIRQACTEPLMKHENKMKSGERQELQLRVVLRPSYKKWSVGPSDLPTSLIRSLQMTLHTVKVPVVSEGELVMSFDNSRFPRTFQHSRLDRTTQ